MSLSLASERTSAVIAHEEAPSPPSRRSPDSSHWLALALAPQVLRRSDGRSSPQTVDVEDVAGDALGPGRPLEPALREDFETRLGADLGGVRLHTGPRAARAAQAVDASAYAIGQNIAFNAGAYAPRTARGRGLLAHELAHVALARDSRAPASGAVGVSQPGDAHERQAERLASRALQGQPAPAPAPPGPPAVVARQDLAEEVAPAAAPTPESAGSSPGGGGGGGGPPPSVPDRSFVMGGRRVDYWLARAGDAHHTYMNVKENASTYWLVEAGPLPADPAHVGAWAKSGSWESRGNRQTATLSTTDFAAAKSTLFSNQSTYHGLVLPYDAWNGPNSNSFTEQMTSKDPRLPKDFWTRDIEWAYWTEPGHTRPF
ncbi:MAG: hypothetical protein QOG42_1288 [Solirubrobacteraceae bacterium]|jgi:hypothetical protein|nr:hypothetical protein [Solirubrobacteraceae bacterium]